MLAEEQRDGSTHDVVAINRDDAEQLAAHLAIRYWTPEAAQLPWIKHTYPL